MYHHKQYPIDISSEVSKALSHGYPLIAMDSSVLTHSGSYPENLESCRELHSVARQQGTVLAAIALLQGRIKVGLSESDMQELAMAPKRPTKISKRDLSSELTQTSYGTLTLPAAMWVSNLVGIKLLTVLAVEGVGNDSDFAFESVEDLTELGIFFFFIRSRLYRDLCDLLWNQTDFRYGQKSRSARNQRG